MATIEGNLWELNFTRVYVIDVSDDYELMRDPLPAVCYPVLAEKWVPKEQLTRTLPNQQLVSGYLYDWHQRTELDQSAFYVAVVRQDLAASLLAQAGLS